MQLPYDHIQIEISGVCNAKCPYCITGQRNLNHEKTGGFMDLQSFRRCIEQLRRKELIHSETVIALYNYGEPLLHPYFSEIISYLEENSILYALSTNASVVPNDEVIKLMKHLQTIQFSVCGSSQESYDRIHKLSYQKTYDNIIHITSLLHKYHPEIECVLKLQMYRFNENEYLDAINFAKQNGMTVIPLHAIFANLEQQLSFIEEYKKDNCIAKNSEQLWYYLDELLEMPMINECPQWDSMVIDETMNVPICCMVTKKMDEYKLTDVFDVTSDILSSRSELSLCKECINSGTAKSICLTPSYKKGLPYESILNRQKGKQIFLIGDNGLAESFRCVFPCFNVSSVSIEEAISHHNSSSFLVFATHMWWQFIPELQARGLIENKDYMVYNTYLR